MKIICPNCATSYDVTLTAIGENGRSVRCARCRGVWFVGLEPERAAVGPRVATTMASSEPFPSAAAPVPPPVEHGRDDPEAGGPSHIPPEAPTKIADLATFDPAGLSMSSILETSQANAVPNTDAPPLVPDDGWSDDDGRPPSRLRAVAARLKSRSWLRGFRLPSTPTAVLILLAINVSLVAWRADVVRVMPQTASLFAAIGFPVNLRGLAFEDVKVVKELQDGVPILVLEGRIANVSRLMLEVPRIRFALRNATGQEVYNWTALPAQPTLAPFTDQPFRTRLASPPADGRQIAIRFFTRRDVANGLQ